MLLKNEEGQMDKPFPWILQPCPPSALFPVLLCLMLTCACSPPAHPFTDWSPYSLVEFSLLPIILPLFLPPFLSVTTAIIKIKSRLSRSKLCPKISYLWAFSLPFLHMIWVTPFWDRDMFPVGAMLTAPALNAVAR